MKNESAVIFNWCCHACGKLLAKKQGNQLHIQIGDKYRYVIDGKVTSVCPRCGAMNSAQTAEIIANKQ